jgi:alpha-L-fucosidase 2
MKKLLSLALAFAMLFHLSAEVVADTVAAPAKKIVACVGDSITYSHGASKRDATTYPAVLQKLLGDEWEVHNFGHNARTALDEGKEWNGQGGMGYRKSPNFAKSKDCKPNYVIFMLGSNDSKKVNWEGNEETFKKNYAALVDEYLALDSKPVVVIGVSPYVQKDRWQITEAVVGGQIAPWQREFAKERGLPIVDIYELTKANEAGSYCDGIHPNDKGYALIAEAFAAKLRELAK